MQKVCYVGGDIGHQAGGIVIHVSLEAVFRYLGSCLPHDKAAGGEYEEHDEDEELGVECSPDKAVPFDLE